MWTVLGGGSQKTGLRNTGLLTSTGISVTKVTCLWALDHMPQYQWLDWVIAQSCLWVISTVISISGMLIQGTANFLAEVVCFKKHVGTISVW